MTGTMRILILVAALGLAACAPTVERSTVDRSTVDQAGPPGEYLVERAAAYDRGEIELLKITTKKRRIIRQRHDLRPDFSVDHPTPGLGIVPGSVPTSASAPASSSAAPYACCDSDLQSTGGDFGRVDTSPRSTR